MSTADLIYKKAKKLPAGLHAEVLSLVEYLSRRRASQTEADAWLRLARETRTLPAVQQLTDEAVAAEIVATRAA